MSDQYGYSNRTPYQRGGHSYGSSHQQHSSQYGHPSNYNNSHHHQGGRGGRGFFSPGNRGSGSGRGWNNQPGYGDRGNNYNNPKNPQPQQTHFPQHHQQHSQSPSSFYPPQQQQQQHQQVGGRPQEPWGNRGGPPRHISQSNESYNYGQLSPNSERHRYTSGEPRNKISPSSDDHRTRLNSDELHRTRNNSDEQHRNRYQSDEQHRTRFQADESHRTQINSGEPQRSRFQADDLHRTRNNSDEQKRSRFQSDEPRRRKTSNSEDQTAYRHRTSSPDSEDRRRKHSSSEDTRSKISPPEMKPGRTPNFEETKPANRMEPSPSRVMAAIGSAKAASTPVKRRFSTQSNEDKDVTMEDAKTESDSDALVIDMDDAEPHDQKEKSVPGSKTFERPTANNKGKSSQDVEPEKSKRPRRNVSHQANESMSDEEDDENSRKSKKSANVAKDFKIPKKKVANQPPPSAPVATKTAANPLGSPLRTEKKFEQVEDALEAMFADLSGDTDEKPPVKTEAVKKEISPVAETSGKPKAATKSASKTQPKESAPKASTSKNTSKVTPTAKKKVPAKKGKHETGKLFPVNQNGNVRINKKKKTATTQQEVLLEKYHGPFVRVHGDLISPRWTHVVNSTSDPLCYQDEKTMEKPDLEAKVRASGFGAHTTTLSSKYDARKPDESWHCVFCKRSSHYQGMGDLFGPYFASKEVMSSVNHRSPSKKQELASKFIIGGAEEKKKKRRKILASSPDHAPSWPQTDQTSPVQQYQHQQNAQASGGVEVWFHEDCVCWMPSLKIVGHSLLGLDEAIRQSHRELCSKCYLTGCTLGCVENGCRETAHFLCARQSGWSIDLESFQALCSTHSSDL